MHSIQFLEDKARICRNSCIELSVACGAAHLSSSLSMIDILVVLYFKVAKKEDVIIVSKAHASEAMYSILAEKRIFSKEEFKTYGEWNSRLQGHAEKCTPGVEYSGGAIGQGLSYACGIALARKRKNKKGRIFCIIGDGECHEGQIWEAAMFAGHHKLNNLVVIIDNNEYSSSSFPVDIESILTVRPLSEKWKAFRWETREVNGHSIEDLIEKLSIIDNKEPLVIVAKTIKGKGSKVLEKSHAHIIYGNTLKEVVEDWNET